MRLGYLVPEFPSQTHIFFWREIRELRRLGAEVFILSTRRPPLDACRHDFALVARKETQYLFPPNLSALASWIVGGMGHVGSALGYLTMLEGDPKARLRQLGFLASAIGLVRWARKNKIDHIHCHSCADSAHVLAFSRRLGGPPFSLTLHGDLDVYGRDHKAKFAEADFVAAVGRHLCEQIVEKTGLDEHRIHSTFMGIEWSNFASLGRQRHGRPGALNLVTVARLHPNKGHFHGLQAIRRARESGVDVTYAIAGEGPFREAIAAKIAELRLEAAVTLLGTVSESEVMELLSNADGFLLTSVGKGEAWPVAVMEAMGAGLPVISSIIGATPEMITEGFDGFLVPQRDEEAISEKIIELARDTNLRARVGSAARTTAQERFDVAKSAGDLFRSISGSF